MPCTGGDILALASQWPTHFAVVTKNRSHFSNTFSGLLIFSYLGIFEDFRRKVSSASRGEQLHLIQATSFNVCLLTVVS